MEKTFFRFLGYLLFAEVVFHLAYFESLSITLIFFLLFFSIIFSIFFTFCCTLFKHQKINTWIFRVIFIFIAFVFSAELIYCQLYDSIFNFNGIVFAGALKDGYDKVLHTIFQNILYIVLFFVPVILNVIRPVKINGIDRIEPLFLLVLLLLSFGYNIFAINYLDRDKQYSYYNLVFKVNIPYLNLNYFGLNTSLFLSVFKNVTGFVPASDSGENIYTNKRTVFEKTMPISYNETSIDFNSLYNNETNPNIKSLHQYFMNQSATITNEFTGMFKDKNVIFIIAESFDEIAIDKDLTPTLYKLKNEGITFNNYFSPKYPASTADGEYMLEWGLLPIIGDVYSLIDMVYNDNPYILPRQLKSLGYSTYAYHNYFGYYNYRKKYFSTLNFDRVRYCQDGINMYCDYFHGSDIDMMEQSIGDYINQDKFFAYYITLSGHGSYDSSNFVANKHLSKLSGYNYPSQLKYYMAANIDFDLAMQHLVTQLENANKLDDTLIVVSSDHSPYYLSNQQVNIRSMVDRSNNFDRNRGSLLIYNSKLTTKYTIDKYAMNIDVLPTILNMLGVEYDSRLIIGKDIMANNEEGLVVFPDRSWVTEKGSYNASSYVFTPYVDNVDDKYISKINTLVNEKFQVSASVQYNNYYKYVFGE